MGNLDYGVMLREDRRLSDFRTTLREYRGRSSPLSETIRGDLADAKRAAALAGEEAFAKAMWCLESIADAQDHYLRAWQRMHEDRYYSAWCELEQAELALHFLARHFDDSSDEYGIAHLHAHIPRWQGLFPYRLFFSPGSVYHEIHCSICNALLTPRKPCGHRLGEIYGGEMAGRVIKRVTPVEFSMVENPVQKYSVAFGRGQRYNYAKVHYVASGLLSPWDSWTTEHTVRRRADPRFVGIRRNDLCPCGSEKKFKRCHADHAWHESPHIDVIFHDRMSRDLPHDVLDPVRHGLDEPV